MVELGFDNNSKYYTNVQSCIGYQSMFHFLSGFNIIFSFSLLTLHFISSLSADNFANIKSQQSLQYTFSFEQENNS